MKNPEEVLLRETIRDLFSLVKQRSAKKTKNEESVLREHIRSLIRIELLNEAGVPDGDPAPHKSTGINVLEDLLKKIIPTIWMSMQIMTVRQQQ